MSKQIYVEKYRTIEMRKGRDGIYRRIPKEQIILGYDSNGNKIKINEKGSLVYLII